MDAPQYVHVDVPSDDLIHWMFYYTNHSDMDAQVYVRVDVTSVYFWSWTFYYTRHSDADAPLYASNTKKKKGSNITILKSGRKHYKMWGTNLLHKYFISRLVIFIKLHSALQI